MTVELVSAGEATPPPVTAEAADAAVEIARIEAERDVELATIHTESNEAQTEAVLEAQAEAEDEDVTWLRGELALLQGRCEMNEVALSNLTGEVEMLRQTQATQTDQIAALLLLTQPPNSEGTPPPDQETPPPDGEAGPRESPAADPAEEAPPPPANVRKRRFLQ